VSHLNELLLFLIILPFANTETLTQRYVTGPCTKFKHCVVCDRVLFSFVLSRDFGCQPETAKCSFAMLAINHRCEASSGHHSEQNFITHQLKQNYKLFTISIEQM